MSKRATKISTSLPDWYVTADTICREFRAGRSLKWPAMQTRSNMGLYRLALVCSLLLVGLAIVFHKPELPQQPDAPKSGVGPVVPGPGTAPQVDARLGRFDALTLELQRQPKNVAKWREFQGLAHYLKDAGSEKMASDTLKRLGG